MQDNHHIFLPGGSKLLRILRGKVQFTDKNVLVIGSGSEKIAEKIFQAGAKQVKVIVNDFDSLISSKLNIPSENQVEIKLMEFENTDFTEKEFDLVFAQGSISSPNRNKIVREIKRILNAEGIICVGEITALAKTYPAFIKDIFEASDILPLHHEEAAKYYEERGFEVLHQQDLTSSLKSFYENAVKELNQHLEDLSGKEKSYYKKELNKISHESNAYLHLGADKFIGYKMLILKLFNSAS